MLSQTVEYGLRAMIHLAALAPDQSVNSEAIAKHTQVPKGYLSKILRDLVVSGLIASQRGPNGGFMLARPAKSISMLDVISAVDPIARIRTCPLGNPNHTSLCPLHRRLDEAIETIERQFAATSLVEILEVSGQPQTGCGKLSISACPGPCADDAGHVA